MQDTKKSGLTPTSWDGGTLIRPGVPWMRWVWAGFLFLMLIMVFHTSGRVAHQIRMATRHWMTASWTLPRLKKMKSFGTVNANMKSGTAGWRPPVSAASLRLGFGWHGQGSQARFSSGVVLAVHRSEQVLSGAAGKVTRVLPHGVQWTFDGYQIRMTGIQPSVTRHARLMPMERVGVARSRYLTLTVTKDGYPLNPLMPALYGTAWIHH